MEWKDRIGRRLKLSDLHVLLAVSEAGSMAKAARLLAVSHPVVSRAVRSLEQTLGVPLLERGRHGIVPTAYGRALIRRARGAFDELRQGVADVGFLSDPTAGEITVGSTVPLATSFVAAVIDRLSRLYPRLVLRVLATESAALLRELDARNVDLLVARRFPHVADSPFAFEALYDDPYVVVVSAQNPLARRRNVTLADLMEERWALPPRDSLVGSVIDQAFRSAGLSYPLATLITFSFEVRNSLLATGRYLTVLPRSLVMLPARRPGLKILPVRLAAADLPIGLVTPKARAPSPTAALFIESARQIAANFMKASGRDAGALQRR